MPTLTIKGLNESIVKRLAASDAAIKSGLTEKPAPVEGDKPAARKPARKRA